MAQNAQARELEGKLEALAGQFGFELVDAGIEKEGPSRYYRIYIDKPGGITLKDCEVYHRACIPLVEHVDYDFLEVCSPGLDRPLKKQKDFERALGQRIELNLFRPRNGIRHFEGTLRSCDGETLCVECGEETLALEMKELAMCRLLAEISEEEIENSQLTQLQAGE
jgi:ribosome maturation factor RimP